MAGDTSLWLCTFRDGPSVYAPVRSREAATNWCEARGHGQPEHVRLAGYVGAPEPTEPTASGTAPDARPHRRSFRTADPFLHLYTETQLCWPTRIVGLERSGGGDNPGGSCRLLDLVCDVGAFLERLPRDERKAVLRVWAARVEDWWSTARGHKLDGDEPPRSTHRRLSKSPAYIRGMAWLDMALQGLLPRQLTIRRHFEQLLVAAGHDPEDAAEMAKRAAKAGKSGTS